MASVMPSGTPETFTGSNGAAPNATNISTAFTSGGGGLSIQGNQLRIRTGATAYNRTSIALTGLSISDVEVVFDWVVPPTLTFALAVLRSNSAVDGGHGYYFTLQASDMILSRHNMTNTYAGPDLQTATHGFVVGQLVRTRIAAFGNVLRARTWLAGTAEATGSWAIQYTDTAGFTTAGLVGWTVATGQAVAADLFLDNIDAKNVVTPTQATLFATASITPGGDLGKTPRKTLLAAISPSGAFTKTRAVVRAFAAAISPSGAMLKTIPKVFGGSISPSAATLKRPAKKMVAQTGPSATLHRVVSRKFVGTISPIGATLNAGVGRLFGRPGLVVLSLINRAEARIRHRGG